MKLANIELGPKVRGKQILEALQKLKTSEDANYFKRQSYAEFMKDPLGRVLNQKQVEMNPKVN